MKNHNEDIIIENRYKVTKELYKKWSKENKATVFFKYSGFWLHYTVLEWRYFVLS